MPHMYILAQCENCKGLGYHLYKLEDSLIQHTCTECNGSGRRLLMPPPDMVKIKGLTDDWDGQQDKDKADEEKADQE